MNWVVVIFCDCLPMKFNFLGRFGFILGFYCVHFGDFVTEVCEI